MQADEDDEEDDDEDDEDVDDDGIPVVEDDTSDGSDDFDKVDPEAGHKSELQDEQFARITSDAMDPCEQVIL